MFQKLHKALGLQTEQGCLTPFTGPRYFCPFALSKILKFVFCISMKINIIQARFILYSVLLLSENKN